jgi:hypothetical protein
LKDAANFHFRLARAKSHPIFSDADLNTDDVVYLNIYQNFLLCAYKMHSYMRDWGLSAKKNAAFIHGAPFISRCYQIAKTSHRHCAEHDPCLLFDYTEQGCPEKTDDKQAWSYTQSARGLVSVLSSI